jgi:hypothetical protein
VVAIGTCCVADAHAELHTEVGNYLADIMGAIGSRARATGAGQGPSDSLPDEVFDLLTSREFCYLGRTRTAPYRSDVVALIRRRVQTEEPLRFFYDIGPGYHASTRPGVLPLRFDVGLSELLILFQINSFCERLSELYPPGGRFWLVIDNLCALRTNDIPVALTERYCARLRELVRGCGLDDRVDLIVESEEFDLAEYDTLLSQLDVEPEPLAVPPPAAVENVERFLGRRCGAAEGAGRIERYRRTSTVTESLLNHLVRGVHMTQRATAATLGFRPFPGGASRTQCGEVVLVHNHKGLLHPTLRTTRNTEGDYVRLAFPDLLPRVIEHVAYASSGSATSAHLSRSTHRGPRQDADA